MREDDVVKKGSRRYKTLKAQEERAEAEARKKWGAVAETPIIEPESKKKAEEIRNVLAAAKPVQLTDLLDEPDMALVNDNRLPAPELPLVEFGEWADFIVTAAQSKCAPPGFVAMALLSATSSLISNVRIGYLMGGWREPTILWGILIGNPSSAKSPAMDVVRDVLRDMEKELAQDYIEQINAYEIKEQMAEAYREEWRKKVSKAAKDGNTPPDMPPEAAEPERPPRPRFIISDSTIQKAAELVMQNPRGLLLCRDELAGLFANLERHGGSDREFYLEAYGGRTFTIDRKMNPEPLIIKHLSMAILGTIQPEKLGRLLTETEDDGLAARFLFVWPNPIPFVESTVRADDATLRRAFTKLRELPFSEEDGGRIVKFDADATARISKWRSELQKREEVEQGVMISFLGKMPGVVVRLAVTLMYLDWAKSDKKQEPTEVPEPYAKRAIALVDKYFVPMARRALGEYSVPQRHTDARIIAKWILRNQCETINLRDMKRASILSTSNKERYEAAVKYLLECGWLTNADARDGTVGRKQKTYLVNPKVFAPQSE